MYILIFFSFFLLATGSKGRTIFQGLRQIVGYPGGPVRHWCVSQQVKLYQYFCTFIRKCLYSRTYYSITVVLCEYGNVIGERDVIAGNSSFFTAQARVVRAHNILIYMYLYLYYIYLYCVRVVSNIDKSLLKITPTRNARF